MRNALRPRQLIAAAVWQSQKYVAGGRGVCRSQHVLPRGFTKIRYFGLLSPSGRAKLDHARHLLQLHAAPDPRSKQGSTQGPTDASSSRTPPPSTVPLPTVLRCSACHRGRLHLIARVGRPRAPP